MRCAASCPVRIFVSLLTLLVWCADAAAGQITVGGGLSDWGVVVETANNHANNFAGLSGGTHTIGGFTYSYVLENSDDNAYDEGFVGPNYGGQNYDAEFLGVGVDDGFLVLAIVCGQRPDNGLARFAPGDIRIATADGDIYGIEVGGGQGVDPAVDGQFTQGAPGTTYSLNSSGFTVAATSSVPGWEQHSAGSVWLNAAWIADPIIAGTPPGDGLQLTQIQFGTGSLVGSAVLSYLYSAALGQHAIIELAIPLSTFEHGTTLTSVQWLPSCGNDLLAIETDITPAPEPASLALLLIGSGIVGGCTRRSTRRRSA